MGLSLKIDRSEIFDARGLRIVQYSRCFATFVIGIHTHNLTRMSHLNNDKSDDILIFFSSKTICRNTFFRFEIFLCNDTIVEKNDFDADSIIWQL